MYLVNRSRIGAVLEVQTDQPCAFCSSLHRLHTAVGRVRRQGLDGIVTVDIMGPHHKKQPSIMPRNTTISSAPMVHTNMIGPVTLQSDVGEGYTSQLATLEVLLLSLQAGGRIMRELTSSSDIPATIQERPRQHDRDEPATSGSISNTRSSTSYLTRVRKTTAFL